MLLSRMDRYVLRETASISLMTLAVLVAITMALFMAELLAEVGQGQAAAGQVFQLLGLRTPEAVLLIGPLALMLGLLMALGQMTQQHELGIFRCSGLGPLQLMKPIMMLAAPWALTLLAVAGWVAPWAQRETIHINENLAEELLISSIRAGQFTTIGNDDLSIYVERINAEQAALENVFIYFPDVEGAEVVTARNGSLQIDPVQGRRILTLYDGIHLRHAAGEQSGMRRIKFERNDIYLPQRSSEQDSNPTALMSLPELSESSLPGALEEWHSRLAPAVAALLFVLIALPVTLERPRGSRFGIVLVALLAYLLYSNAVHVVLAGMEQSVFWSRFGLWPMHAAALLVLLGFWSRWYRQW